MANRSTEPRRQRRAAWLLGLVVLALVASAAPARAEEQYDPKRAGNLVRIAAYILSPAGVLIDYAIMRPAWWIGSHEPFRTIFGRTD
ncbi:MAG TPA: hypothetical protein VKM54_21695 [Myxococcota bacterium]|nr:hypothetical protein [Myxococcota bacterium]